MASVRLKPELEFRLRRVANLTGKSKSRIIQEAVEEHCESVLNGGPLSDAWAEYIGAFSSEGKSDASKMNDIFGEILEEKRRQGRL